MQSHEELKHLLASFERLAAYTTSEERRRRLLQVIADIRGLLAERADASAGQDSPSAER